MREIFALITSSQCQTENKIISSFSIANKNLVLRNLFVLFWLECRTVLVYYRGTLILLLIYVCVLYSHQNLIANPQHKYCFIAEYSCAFVCSFCKGFVLFVVLFSLSFFFP